MRRGHLVDNVSVCKHAACPKQTKFVRIYMIRSSLCPKQANYSVTGITENQVSTSNLKCVMTEHSKYISYSRIAGAHHKREIQEWPFPRVLFLKCTLTFERLRSCRRRGSKRLKISVKWHFGPKIFSACGALKGASPLAADSCKINVIMQKAHFAIENVEILKSN